MQDLPDNPYRPMVTANHVNVMAVRGELNHEKARQLTEIVADLQGIAELTQSGTVEEKLQFILAAIAGIASRDAHAFLLENDMLHMETFLKDPQI